MYTDQPKMDIFFPCNLIMLRFVVISNLLPLLTNKGSKYLLLLGFFSPPYFIARMSMIMPFTGFFI